MSSSVQIKDLGLDRIMKDIKAFRGIDADAGIFDNSRTDDAPGNAGLMAIHEFGAPSKRIPSRPVLRTTAKNKDGRIERMLEDGVSRVVENTISPKNAMLRVVKMLSSEMQKTITRSFGLASNRPSTIAAKGSSRPLIDTAQMKNSFSERVSK